MLFSSTYYVIRRIHCSCANYWIFYWNICFEMRETLNGFIKWSKQYPYWMWTCLISLLLFKLLLTRIHIGIIASFEVIYYLNSWVLGKLLENFSWPQTLSFPQNRFPQFSYLNYEGAIQRIILYKHSSFIKEGRVTLMRGSNLIVMVFSSLIELWSSD